MAEEKQDQKSNQAGSRASARKGNRAQNRTKRIPVSGNRDILSVLGKDPYFHYRWVLDLNEEGERVQRFMMAGYELVHTSEIEGHGARQADRPSDSDSVVKKPSGNTPHGVPQYLYLMKIPYDFYTEDQQAKLQDIEERERDMMREQNPDFDDGRYGSVNIR